MFEPVSQMVEGDYPPWAKKMGCLCSLLQMYDSLVTDISRIVSDLCITQSINNSSYEVFTLVWVVYQLTKLNKYNT